MVEAASQPMCMSSLGGVEILSGYQGQRAGTWNRNEKENSIGRQVHWYDYPLFAMINGSIDNSCGTTNSFDSIWMTEVDPTWQNDAWANITVHPEAVLFNNPVAQAACSADSIAADYAYPLDPLFWCTGSTGVMYPWTKHVFAETTTGETDMLAITRFLAKQHRIGALLGTVSPAAQCGSFYSPLWIKNQYRIDPVGPFPVNSGSPIYPGKHRSRWRGLMPGTVPSTEYMDVLIWRAVQCCVNF